tara:strand:- start:765 stop:1043 length:279 start_codon:yes stop_codon:yes gene_type:complete
MKDTPQLQGAPITINQEDGSSKIYDTGMLSVEAQQSVDMIAFIARLRNVLDAAGQVFSNVVTNSLIDEALVEEVSSSTKKVEEDTTDDEKTK